MCLGVLYDFNYCSLKKKLFLKYVVIMFVLFFLFVLYSSVGLNIVSFY